MNAAEFLASGFYTGFSPRAPGTVGSVIGLMIGAALLLTGHFPLLFGLLVASGVGVWSIGASGGARTDPGWVVIDEIAGQMLAMLALARVSIIGLLLAFALFRLFDIWKPGPVRWADSHKNQWGVMGDDWIAGMLAGLCLLALQAVVTL